jgi:hypothetical protein
VCVADQFAVAQLMTVGVAIMPMSQVFFEGMHSESVFI